MYENIKNTVNKEEMSLPLEKSKQKYKEWLSQDQSIFDRYGLLIVVYSCSRRPDCIDKLYLLIGRKTLEPEVQSDSDNCFVEIQDLCSAILYMCL